MLIFFCTAERFKFLHCGFTICDFGLTDGLAAGRNFRDATRAFNFMTTAKKSKYSRILLKLSGEALGGENGIGICSQAVRHMAEQIREVRELGVQVVVVVGGGNIFRGASGSEHGIERATGDYMGMLATIINALALQDALEKLGSPTRVQSAIVMAQVADPVLQCQQRDGGRRLCHRRWHRPGRRGLCCQQRVADARQWDYQPNGDGADHQQPLHRREPDL